MPPAGPPDTSQGTRLALQHLLGREKQPREPGTLGDGRPAAAQTRRPTLRGTLLPGEIETVGEAEALRASRSGPGLGPGISLLDLDDRALLPPRGEAADVVPTGSEHDEGLCCIVED